MCNSQPRNNQKLTSEAFTEDLTDPFLGCIADTYTLKSIYVKDIEKDKLGNRLSA